MKFKNSDPADFSAGDHGKISGYFATFHHDHGDSYGDVIRKGAFANTINERKKTGHPFPLCFNHDLSMIIGMVTDIGEDDFGAWFKAEFFPFEKAQEVRNIVKSGVLWQFSFAYNVLDQGKIKAGDGSMVNELRELDLFEISIVTVPANSRATVTDVKTSREKLLHTIRGIEGEQNRRKEELLRFINDNKKDASRIDSMNLSDSLARLRKMESDALRDIGRADVESDAEWKTARKQALAAIRS